MANPSALIEHSVHLFLTQWFSGLQPSLYINTHSDGEVFVCSKVKGCLQQPPIAIISRRRRSSGQRSREKRRAKRSEAHVSNVVREAENKLVVDDGQKNRGYISVTENLPLTFGNSSTVVEPDINELAPVYVEAAVQAAKSSDDAECQATPDYAEIHCRSCDLEFQSWNDYSQHMKTFSFMCSNCLDYFTEKPWFSISDLIFIDVDGGVHIYHRDAVLDLSRYDRSQLYSKNLAVY